MEELCVTIMPWLTNPDGDLADTLAMLQAKAEQEPKSATCAIIGSIMCGLELLCNPTHSGLERVASIAKYFAFCASDLRLPKKDLPKALTDRLDKSAKDSRLSVDMPPPPSPSLSNGRQGSKKVSAPPRRKAQGQRPSLPPRVQESGRVLG